MAASEGGGIAQCYNDIVRADTTCDYDRALKACNRRESRREIELTVEIIDLAQC